MADLARIKRNVSKMASMKAPKEQIDGYIESEGVTVDDVKNFKNMSIIESAASKVTGISRQSKPDQITGTIKRGVEYGGRTLNSAALGIPQFISSAFNKSILPQTKESNLSPDEIESAETLGSIVPIGGAAKMIGKGSMDFGRALKVGMFQNDFIFNKLAPAVEKTAKKSFEIFNSGAKDFSIKFGMKPEVAEHIYKIKPKNIVSSGDNVADVSDEIKFALDKKLKSVRGEYDKAFKSVSSDKSIDVSGSYLNAKRILKKYGVLDEQGISTKPLAEVNNAALNKIYDFYLSFRPLPGQNKIISGKVNKHTWMLFKDNLTKAYRAEPNQKIDVKSLLESMHKDAEKSGMVGISKARDSFRKYLSIEDVAERYIPSSSNTSLRLDRIFEISNNNKEEIKNIKNVERALGIDIINKSKNIVSKKEYLSTLEKVADRKAFHPSVIGESLSRAASKKELRNTIKQDYDTILGNGATDAIFKDIDSFSKSQTARKLATSGILIYGGYEILRRKIFRPALDSLIGKE